MDMRGRGTVSRRPGAWQLVASGPTSDCPVARLPITMGLNAANRRFHYSVHDTYLHIGRYDQQLRNCSGSSGKIPESVASFALFIVELAQSILSCNTTYYP